MFQRFVLKFNDISDVPISSLRSTHVIIKIGHYFEVSFYAHMHTLFANIHHTPNCMTILIHICHHRKCITGIEYIEHNQLFVCHVGGTKMAFLI